MTTTLISAQLATTPRNLAISRGPRFVGASASSVMDSSPLPRFAHRLLDLDGLSVVDFSLPLERRRIPLEIGI
jgi:hypothetical protein